jgi:predicted nucleic acid-binding protein
MSVEFFVDTNVLVYAASGSSSERVKQRRALDVFKAGRVGISTQVLQEFYVTVTRKVEVKLTPTQAIEWIDQFNAAECFVVDAAAVRAAIILSSRFKVSYWDAAIIVAAQALEATTLYSEDLNSGQAFGLVRVVNPFVGS